MRWALTLIGEHVEGLEAREVFEGIVAECKDRLLTRGFRTVFQDHSLDVERDVPVEPPVLPETVPAPPPEVVERWAKEDKATIVRSDASFTKAFLVPKEVANVMSTASLRAAIRRLKKEIGGNRILSQAEIAEKLGVSRYQIRKALGK